MTHEQTSALQPLSDKHTPGPWSISGVGPKSRTIYRATSGSVYPVCDVTADNLNRYGAGDLDANTRLIATAPELLEALEKAGEIAMNAQPEDYEKALKEIRKLARAAIAKARGRA